MKAIIMAGGMGTRLRPLTCEKPKPMVSILDKPVIVYIIELLKQHGIDKIGITLKYMSGEIMDYLGNGENYGVELQYFIEDSPLGTAGSVKNAAEFLDEDFIVISGDAITDIDLTEAMDSFQKSGALATIVLSKVDVALEYGVVVLDRDGNVSRFIEKPSWSEVFSDLANTGIYVFQPRILDYIPQGRETDFSKDVFPALLAKREKLCGYVSDGYWCDIGDIDAYKRCQNDILNGKVKVRLEARKIAEGVYIGEHVTLADSSSITPPCYLGGRVQIGEQVQLGSYSIIGSGTKVEDGCVIVNSVVGRGVKVGEGSSVIGAVLTDGVQVKNDCIIDEMAVMGERSTADFGAHLLSGVRVWPGKYLPRHAEIASDVVFDCRQRSDFFEDGGVSEKDGGRLEPDFLCDLAQGFGSLLKDGKIAVARDSSDRSSALFHLMTGALLNAGQPVYDFEIQNMGALRKGIVDYGLDGGIYISGSDEAKIIFLDSFGSNIDMEFLKKLKRASRNGESLFNREAQAAELVKIYDYRLRYEHFLTSMAGKEIKGACLCLFTSDLRMKKLYMSLSQKLDFSVDCYPPGERPDSRTGYDLYLAGGEGEVKLCRDDATPLEEADTSILDTQIKLSFMKLKKMVIPVHLPNEIEKLAQKSGVETISCKTQQSDYMKKVLAFEGREAFAFSFNSVLHSLKLLEFCRKTGKTIQQMADSLPGRYMRDFDLDLPDSRKGIVIKTLCGGTEKMDLTDGVKIFDKRGWVLFVPNNKYETIRVVSEGYSQESAEELCDFYLSRIEKYLKKNE